MKRINLLAKIVSSLPSKYKILDVGCCDMPATQINNDKSLLHNVLRNSVKTKKNLLGIDNNFSKIKLMKSLDYNCLYDDITKTKIKTKFDLIIVGELIEHIQSLDLLMKNLKKLLNKNGKIYMSSPNPNGIMSVIGYWLILNERGGEGHVLWQSPKTMRHLCHTNDLYLNKVIHCDWDYPKLWMHIAKPFEIFSRLKPTLVFEIIKKIN